MPMSNTRRGRRRKRKRDDGNDDKDDENEHHFDRMPFDHHTKSCVSRHWEYSWLQGFFPHSHLLLLEKNICPTKNERRWWQKEIKERRKGIRTRHMSQENHEKKKANFKQHPAGNQRRRWWWAGWKDSFLPVWKWRQESNEREREGERK